MSWIRARSDEQIEQRIHEIVDATARLYEENNFEDITFAMIAKEASFTRSNLYRYFETKEDIFLELLKYDIAGWRKEVLAQIADENASLQSFAAALVDLALKHQRMIKLFTILFTLLERNASLEALTAFKQQMTQEIGLVANHLVKILPFHSTRTAAEFVSAFSYLLIGAFPMMNLTPKQVQAMDEIGMVTSPDDYRETLLCSVEFVLQGFIHREA